MSNSLSSKEIASSPTGRAGGGSAYSSLWKTEQQMEEDGKPQSAYAVVQQILAKAEAEGQRGQALSARLRAIGLHQEWAPDSFFTDVAELEALRAAEKQPEAQAVYASILAEAYQVNRYRSQASRLQLSSEEMKEWTREQYDSAATENWFRSLKDAAVLAKAQSSDWLPFVKQNNSSAFFHHDLLHILWQRFRDQRSQLWGTQRDDIVAMGNTVAETYRQTGNREAEMLVLLDLIELTPRQKTISRNDYAQDDESSDEARQAACLDLIKRFGDLPVATEVYLRLLNTEASDSLKASWAQEALRRYPRYDRIDEVRNRLNNLQQPNVTWTGNEFYYPGKQYTWKLEIRNATHLTMTVYRLKESFNEEAVGTDKKSVAEYFRKNAERVAEIDHSIEPKAPFETTEDSLSWTAPEVGRYGILFTARTDEREATRRTVTDRYSLFRVSKLKPILRNRNDDEKEVIVVDAETGQPVEGATVSLYAKNNNTDRQTSKQTLTTDAEGRARFRGLMPRTRYFFTVIKGEDRYLPESASYTYSNRSEERTETVVRLYTDRAIYRPGQTVHLGGIAYSQQHWDAAPIENYRAVITVRDANWKEVEKQELMSDEMGVFSTEFTLPQGSLPGYYRIQTSNASIGFRVEEYKRPTFEVKMDEAPALQWPQDSITLTGKALGYNGLPVRSGRVTGSYQFSYPFPWWFRRDDSPTLPIDTVSTDEMGAFRVSVPLSDIPAEALRYGLVLALNVEVLSAAGETREGSLRVPLCTTPLRLNITLQEQQDRDRIVPPTFTALSSTGKAVEADIRCRILNADSEDIVAAEILPKDLPDAFRALPSGEYELHATARAGADTASAKASFYVFSMQDTRVPRHAKEWLYCPVDTFDASHPARLQVGSSFHDVALYYSLVAKDGLIEDRLIRLSDEVQTLEIPYNPRYGDGVTANFVFVKGGELYTMTKALRCTMPDNQLRWQWTTFRDGLHPGDQETWTLRITRPDGTPASANLMATLYDASLDQIIPHSWQLAVNRYHRLRYESWLSEDYFRLFNAHTALYFPMKTRNVHTLDFDCIDPRWTEGLAFSSRSLNSFTGARPMMRSAKATMNMAMVETADVEEAAPMDTAVRETAGAMKASSQQREEAEPEEQGAEGQGAEARALDAVTLRSNFQETAAFLPQLHTDENGEVTLSFTLPESLTTWQLLGVAHTGDMMTANIQAQAIARKEMMAQLYLPRFLHAGDEATLRATIQNLTEAPLNGKARLEIIDPESQKVIRQQTTNFKAEANGEAVLCFDYTPSEDYPIVAVRLTAASKTFSDGEQRYLAILPAKEWVTESVEIQADSLGTFTTDLSSLFNHDSPTATQRRLTVDYTTHPIWNVVQALPALREPQHDDVLSLTAAFYANALTQHIVSTTPRLREVITQWSSMSPNHGDLTSPLAQDEDLKQLVLDETPWLREATKDTERRAQLIDLFNENLCTWRLDASVRKLMERQNGDGSFSWFPGMKGSEIMTRVVCIELTHLRTLTNGFKTLPTTVGQQAASVLRQAFHFVAARNAELIAEMKKAEQQGATIQTGTLMHLDYIYISQRAGVELTKAQRADVRYLLDHLKGSVAGMSNNERAVAAIVLKADGRQKDAKTYFDSMREHLTTTAKHGTYFDYAGGSFTPTGNKIVVHTAAMEAAEDMAPTDKHLRAGLLRWLLQQKRTQMWESNICTIDAIYALLHDNHDELRNTAEDKLTLNYARRKVSVPATPADGAATVSPAALGYIRETYTDGAAPKSITVQRNSNSEAWGAVYAQYLTPLADASAHAEGLVVQQELSSRQPRLGDKLTTRYIITADRDYEYVCLRANRAACAEPAEQLSGYHWQGGLGYYRAVRDAHTDYFFDRLPKGTYVLEETAFIDRAGHYTTGLTTLRCLYAPEYGANTPAVELKIKE